MSLVYTIGIHDAPGTPTPPYVSFPSRNHLFASFCRSFFHFFLYSGGAGDPLSPSPVGNSERFGPMGRNEPSEWSDGGHPVHPTVDDGKREWVFECGHGGCVDKLRVHVLPEKRKNHRIYFLSCLFSFGGAFHTTGSFRFRRDVGYVLPFLRGTIRNDCIGIERVQRLFRGNRRTMMARLFFWGFSFCEIVATFSFFSFFEGCLRSTDDTCSF